MSDRYGGIDEPYEFNMPYGGGNPGDLYPMNADLTLYWPFVRECWEETPF